MFNTIAIRLGSCSRRVALLFSLVLLSACANTWSAKVTTYQDWPVDAFSSSYFIQSAPESQSPLIHQTVADSVRAAMGAVGLVEGGPESRLQVKLLYGNPITQEWTSQLADPYFNGFHRHGFMLGGFGYGNGFGGAFYSPPLVSVPVNVYTNKLQIIINDKVKEMAEIYNVTVIHESDSDNLMSAMPYLARAAFTDFPGMNGKTQYIKIKRNQ